MNIETAKTIIIWTLTVFVAGLIGYFGRFLAMMAIDRFRKNKNLTGEKDNQNKNISPEIAIAKEKAKLAKKKAKNEYKLNKKLNKG